MYGGLISTIVLIVFSRRIRLVDRDADEPIGAEKAVTPG